MIKKASLALAALVAGVTAQAELSVTTDITYVTDYVFRGFQLDNSSVQPSIEVSYADFYAGVWHSNGLSNNTNPIETDLYAGYNFAINETFKLDVGVTRYLYDGQSTGDTTEGYIGLSADVLLSPSLYYYHDFDRELNSYIASIGYSLPVDAINSSLDFTAALGYIQIPGNNDYTYGSVGVAIPYKLAENATLTVGGEYVRNDTEFLGTSGDKRYAFVGKVGLSIGF